MCVCVWYKKSAELAWVDGSFWAVGKCEKLHNMHWKMCVDILSVLYFRADHLLSSFSFAQICFLFSVYFRFFFRILFCFMQNFCVLQFIAYSIWLGRQKRRHKGTKQTAKVQSILIRISLVLYVSFRIFLLYPVPIRSSFQKGYSQVLPMYATCRYWHSIPYKLLIDILYVFTPIKC